MWRNPFVFQSSLPFYSSIAIESCRGGGLHRRPRLTERERGERESRKGGLLKTHVWTNELVEFRDSALVSFNDYTLSLDLSVDQSKFLIGRSRLQMQTL